MTQSPKAYALDASVLVELMAGTMIVKGLVESLSRGEVEAYVTRLSLSEALYVAFRMWGEERARQRLHIILEAGVPTPVEDVMVWQEAADCKCKLPISLGDCYTLALAKTYGLTPLFLRPEKDIKRNISKVEEWLGRPLEYLIP